MKALRYLTVVASFPLLVATGCGGGGDDSVAAADPPQPGKTYGDTNLPGHLLVAAGSGPASLYDLRTGQGTSLPTSSFGGDNWNASTNPDLVVRVSGNSSGTSTLEIVRTSDWTRVGAPVEIAGNFHRPKVSPDGKYILTFWAAQLTGTHILTIFDAVTGQVVKSGSRLDNQTVISSPAAWLLDGRYLYLVGNQLYASSPATQADQFVGTLPLPDNSLFGNGELISGRSNLVVSPDGTKLALGWSEQRTAGGTWDTHIFVANTDATGLHRLTLAPDLNSALEYNFSNPTWSPDSKWVAGVMYMDGNVVTPSFPPDSTFGGIVGSTGCETNPAFVLPADANRVAISWPTYDAKYGIKVRNSSGTGGKWVSTCQSAQWVK